MQLFLAVFVMDGRDEHTAGVDAHHGAGREIGDGDADLVHQFLRLIILMNAAQDDAILAGTVVGACTAGYRRSLYRQIS